MKLVLLFLICSSQASSPENFLDMMQLCTSDSREMLASAGKVASAASVNLAGISKVLTQVQPLSEQSPRTVVNPMDQIMVFGIVSTWLNSDNFEDRSFIESRLANFANIRDPVDVDALFRDILARKTLDVFGQSLSLLNELELCLSERLTQLQFEKNTLFGQYSDLEKTLSDHTRKFASAHKALIAVKELAESSPEIPMESSARWIDSKMFRQAQFELGLILSDKRVNKKLPIFLANLTSRKGIVPIVLWNICRKGYKTHVDAAPLVARSLSMRGQLSEMDRVIAQIESTLLSLDDEFVNLRSKMETSRKAVVAPALVEWTSAFH